MQFLSRFVFFKYVVFALFFLLALTFLFPPWGVKGGENSVMQAYGNLLLDTTHLQDGYFFVATTTPSQDRIKLKVEKDQETLFYDLEEPESPELITAQMGDGFYTVSLFERVEGNRYQKIGSACMDVHIQEDEKPFLIPNQYVPYTKQSPCVQKAEELCREKSEEEKVQIITDYIKTNFLYDYIKALTVKAKGVLPEIEETYEKKMGICQDLAAVTAAMLRSQGIPTKLVIGQVNEGNHAWCSIMLQGEETLFDPTWEILGQVRAREEYKPERWY